MSLQTVCTIEDLKSILEKTVSQKRYLHSIGVAQTTEMLLEHYKCVNYEKTWNGFSAGEFCGVIHDLAREVHAKDLVAYCRDNAIEAHDYEFESPVLLHGKVSAHMALKLCPGYPESWRSAVDVHTTGDSGMDDLALALFAADFIEPTRTFLTDEKRNEYISNPSLDACVYAILCDMIAHWKEKGYHEASMGSMALKKDLETRLGI